MTKEEMALEFFQHNVTYLEEEQARKMASEDRSLTYRAFIAGFNACEKEIEQRTKDTSYGQLQSERDRLKSALEQIRGELSIQHIWSVAKKALLEGAGVK